MFRQSLLTIAFAVLGASWTAIAFAQASDAPVTESPQQALSYSDAELKSFTLAALNVQRIKGLYQPKLEAAKTPEQEQEVRKAATSEMVQAIESEGMTVSKYTEDARQVQQGTDPGEGVQGEVRGACDK